MSFDRTRLGVTFAAVALVFSLLTLLSWEFMRDAIAAPIYNLLRACVLLLEELPHQGYVALLAVLILFISLDTIRRLRGGRPDTQHEDDLSQTDSRYLQWRRLYENQQYNWFLRNKFALEVRYFLLSLLAFQAEKDAAEIETIIKDGSLPVPDLIKHLIQHQTIQPASGPAQPAKLQAYLMSPETHTQLDPFIDDQVAEIVGFIEQSLEINHVGNRSSS